MLGRSRFRSRARFLQSRALPTLSLDFLAGAPLDSRITFSRTTNATLVDATGRVTYAPNNLLTYSEQFDNAAWTKTNSTITANATTAPDGTLTADKHIPNNGATLGVGASETRVFQSPSATIGVNYMYSMYAKAGEYDEIQFAAIATPTVTARFSLTLGTVISGAGATITSVGDGWYRCALPIVAGATGALAIRWSAQSSTVLVGDGTSGIFVWGSQFEAVTYQTLPSTYVQTVASAYYGPRFDYNPATLAPRGLLIEEQRVNLLLYSAEFDNAGWTKAGATITANATTSPDGTVNAEKLVENTGVSTQHRIQQAVVSVIGTSYTYSVYLKAGERTVVTMRIIGTSTFAGCTVNLTAGTISAITGAATITNAGNGWYRVSVTGTADSLLATCYVNLTDGSSITYTGDGVSGAFLYGAQLEAGTFATSYIPTVASTVTRAADIAVMTGANFSSWYNQSEGTVVVECNQVVGANSTSIAYAISDNTFNNSQYAIYTGGNAFRAANLVVGGVGQPNLISSFSVANVAVPIKDAFAYAVDNFGESLGGQTTRTDSLGIVNTASNRMYIGSSWSGTGNYTNGHIRSLTYYATRLTNAQLQALSA